MFPGNLLPFHAGQNREDSFSASDLEIQVVTTREGLSDLESDYDHLHETAGNVLPFTLLEWHLAWWDHFAQSSNRIRDSLFVHVVRRGNGEAVGLIPLVLTAREIAGLKVGTIGLLGADPNVTELRTALVAPGAETQVAEALQRRLAAEREWDWIHWSCADGPFSDALRDSAPVDWQEPILDYVLDLAPTWEAFRGGLKRNIRESLRHCYNSLKRDGFPFEFEIATTATDIRQGVGTFLKLHAWRATMTGTVSHPNRFPTESSQRFLFDVCDRLAARGIARVFLLRIAGNVVAARVGFVVGSSLYLYYSGFDPNWGKYSVSTTLLAEAVKYAIALGLTTVNLSAGTDPSKTRWGARPVSFHAGVQPRPRLRSQIAYATYCRLLARRDHWLVPLLIRVPRRSWG
jgi:CelD/BcsL family acetyltransferase involved in cellulose biosynthesis